MDTTLLLVLAGWPTIITQQMFCMERMLAAAGGSEIRCMNGNTVTNIVCTNVCVVWLYVRECMYKYIYIGSTNVAKSFLFFHPFHRD